jgi:beta-phosphoglucomutase-like phosphatase (HAD superfamily)
MIKAILYDLDGVLVDACEWHYESLNRALKAVCDIEISRQDHNSKYNGLPTKVKLEMLCKEGLVKPEQFDRIWQLKQDYTIEVINQKADPYIEKLELHNYTQYHNIISVCVTNSIRETATLMLDKTWQLSYMKFLVCNEDTEKPKPAPDPYLLAMKRLYLHADECIIVEDSDKGYASAKASGAHVIRVRGCHDVDKQLIKGFLHE